MKRVIEDLSKDMMRGQLKDLKATKEDIAVVVRSLAIICGVLEKCLEALEK
jgi:hypothetical protein